MPSRIDHSALLRVVLDMDALVAVLSPRFAGSLASNPDRETSAAGRGTGKSQTIHLLERAEVQFGPDGSLLTRNNKTVALTPIDYVAEQDGYPTDAIFGSSFFRLQRQDGLRQKQGRLLLQCPNRRTHRYCCS